MSDVGNGKTLSKSLLYLPLVAYDTTISSQEIIRDDGPRGGGDGNTPQDQHPSSDPHAYMASRKSLPKSVVEKSLIDFWHKVGVEYHRHQATARDSKNNGSRPLSASEMDDRIRQRALMLVGGGINTAISSGSTTKNNAKDNTQQASSRKRKQLHKRATTFEAGFLNDKVDRFLHQLNGLWNDYIFELLQLEQQLSLAQYHAMTRCVKFWSQVTSMITHETAQLVGANVRIKACPPKKHLEGQRGFLMGNTKNTWTIMMSKKMKLLKSKSKLQKNDNQSGENRNKSNDADIVKRPVWKSVIVPKRGAILSLLIPVKVDGWAPSSNADNDITDGKEKTPLLVVDLKEDV